MTKLETYLAQVKERAENATDGPCEVVRFDNDDGSISWQVETHISADQDHRIIGWYSEHGDNPRIRHDAIFDAHSRTDIPKLLQIIEVYRSALDHYSKLQDWDLLPSVAIDAIAKGEEIAGRG